MEEKYRLYYVLYSVDRETESVGYFTDTLTRYGSYYYGDVLEAKRFSSLEEIADLLHEPFYQSQFFFGINIVQIANVTFQKLEESKATNGELYRKFHDPLYITA